MDGVSATGLCLGLGGPPVPLRLLSFATLLLVACAPLGRSSAPEPSGRLGAVVDSGFLVPARPALPPELTVTLQESSYLIEGSTIEALNASMRERSPFRKGPNREGADGYTAWEIRWRFRTAPTPEGCRLEDIRVTLSLETTVYDWVPPPGVEPEIVDAVDEARTRLLNHEREHQTLGILGALDLVDHLRARSTSDRTCARLRDSVNAEGNRILDRLIAVNREFDVVTRSGTVPPPGAP